jgi:energy-coupling factor transporter ATP-binding protein EcfA2
MIRHLDQDRFKEIVRTYLTPARPISDPQYLKGRERALTQIERAFNSPGKHVFIFGDRGVGKTSLAQSAAVLHQSADNQPITIACASAAAHKKWNLFILVPIAAVLMPATLLVGAIPAEAQNLKMAQGVNV